MDAVLLTGFAHADKADRLLDLGTGTGIIPILMEALASPAVSLIAPVIALASPAVSLIAPVIVLASPERQRPAPAGEDRGGGRRREGN